MSVSFLIKLSKKLDIRYCKGSQISCYFNLETMNTSLKHLSPGQRQQLERVIAIIVKAIRPEQIVLFGVYADAVNIDLPPVLGAFDLLVVSRQGDRRSDYELQDLLENRCREAAPVTVLVHDIAYVNRRIVEGQYFFYSVVREGILLYNAGGTPLAPAELPDWEQVRSLAKRDFERWAQQARAFHRSADFNYKGGEERVAVFLLHQAAEQIYQAILLAFTGYKPTTHNLDKLRRYTNRFSLELAMVFPRDNEGEDGLFRLLLAGYVEARYKEDFATTQEQVRILLERVGLLIAIAGRICGNHFVRLEKQAAGG
jgi:uncharacterized protein